MWIVALALRRPYTFVVVALLLLILGPIVIFRTPTDIFPNIDIPVVSILWNYAGLNAQDMSSRIVTLNERVLTTTVDDVEHSESQSLNGIAVVKVFFQPHANIEKAIAQITAISQTQLRQLPPGTTPPLIITYNASTVPILQLALSGQKLSEQQLFDYGVNFIRTRLVTIPGAAIPYPYGGKQRQVQVDLDTNALQSKGLSPVDVVNAISAQNLILPSGTSKIGQFEYDVDLNGSPQTVAELNDLPIKRVGNTTIYIRDVAYVRDGFPPQTNIVRVDGQEGIAAHHPENRERFDAGHHFRNQAAAAADPGPASAGTRDQASGRPVRFRARLHQRRVAGRPDCRLPYRPDDSDFPGQLAQHGDHRGFDSAVDSYLHHRHERAGRDHQHHDAGRTGARGRHSGGRRHRGN